jgi:hypothetical protein
MTNRSSSVHHLQGRRSKTKFESEMIFYPELTQNTAIQLNRQVSLRPLSFADYLTRYEALGRAQGPEVR